MGRKKKNPTRIYVQNRKLSHWNLSSNEDPKKKQARHFFALFLEKPGTVVLHQCSSNFSVYFESGKASENVQVMILQVWRGAEPLQF